MGETLIFTLQAFHSAAAGLSPGTLTLKSGRKQTAKFCTKAAETFVCSIKL